MKKLANALALFGLVSGTSLQAAQDTGLVLLNTGPGQRGTGIGVTAGVKIKLGPDRLVKRSERVRLGVSAGPVIAMPDPSATNGIQRRSASFVGLEIKPGYSSSLNIAGKPVMDSYTLLGAAEKEEDKGKQSTGEKIAWVALVAGVGTVVVLGGLLIYVTNCDDCSE